MRIEFRRFESRILHSKWLEYVCKFSVPLLIWQSLARLLWLTPKQETRAKIINGDYPAELNRCCNL